MVAFTFQSWRSIGLILVAGLVAGFAVREDGLVGIAVMNAAGWALMSMGLAARCLRCQYSLAPSRNPFADQPSKDWCPMCGRSRKGVWPFQYLTKPETWDGEYHDEGGGAVKRDGVRDWWRDVLFKRYRKRLKL